ncbi:MAG: UDP-N-acetylmuramate dehydrogenase [Elusimicrobiota bacterium]
MNLNIQKNILLSPYTSYGTGGSARFFIIPETEQDISESIKWADSKNIRFFVLGEGTNVLVSDKGYDGLIIKISRTISAIQNKDFYVISKAGTLLEDLVNHVNKCGFSGMEKLAGIPGSVGGAVAMNAGAFGQEIKDNLKLVKYIDNKGDVRTSVVEDMAMGYRTSLIRQKGGIIFEAEFSFDHNKTKSPQELKLESLEIIKKRVEKQPLEFKSCGSVFKRPPGSYAGALIEECGLKGFRIGGAGVSQKHANFIINIGDATSLDIYRVIQHVKEAVFKKRGVNLECEVVFLGDFCE